jgi:hypothetical protein
MKEDHRSERKTSQRFDHPPVSLLVMLI